MVKKMVIEQVTNNELARMIAEGFAGTASKDSTTTKDEMSAGFARLGDRINNLEKKVGRLEFKIDHVQDMVSSMEEGELLDLQKRVQTLEKIINRSKKLQ